MTAQPTAELRSFTHEARCLRRLPMGSDDEAPRWCQRTAGHHFAHSPRPDEVMASPEPWPLPNRVWRGARSFRRRWGTW